MGKIRIRFAIFGFTTLQAASAATLVFYDINEGGANTDILGVESHLAGVSATELSLNGNGVSVSTTSNTIFVSFANAPSATGSHYIEFTLTPAAAGLTLDLTNLSFEYFYDGSGSSGSGDAFWDLSVNIDGAGFVDVGSNPDATFNNPISSVPSPLPSATVPLGFTGVTSAVFRLSMYDDDGASTTAYIKTSSITVTGDLVPEPGTAVLGTLGLTGLLIRRRR